MQELHHVGSTLAPILIIEDSDEDYDVCVAALEEDGSLNSPILRCETGAEALALLERMSRDGAQAFPSLVMLDLNLPGHSGFDILERIKSDETSRRIPVVVVTSSKEPSDVVECYRNGANSFVQKPPDFDGFMTKIRQIRDFWFKIAILPDPKWTE